MFRDKWVEIVDSTEPVDFAKTREAVVALYDLLHLKPPSHFEVFPSPHAAFASFEKWRKTTGRFLNMMWDYQLPLCDPDGYWRQYGKPRTPIHFATRRKPNKHRCYTFVDEASPEPTTFVSDELHKDLWAEFSFPRPRSWCDVVADSLWDSFPQVSDAMNKILDREDPTCQAGIDEFIFLGPFDWLQHEVACVDYCNTELGVSYDAQLFATLESLLRFGGFVLTFQKLCIICERPTSIDPSIVFKDGTEVQWPTARTAG